MQFEREVGVKSRRQFVLSDIASWHKIRAFGEEGGDALRNAHRSAQSLKKDDNVNGSWDHNITPVEREGRKEEEVIKVVDWESA